MPYGMVTEIKALQLIKASSPIDVTLVGIIKEVKLRQAENAAEQMDLIPSGIIVLSHPLIKVLDEVSMIALQFSRESYTGFPYSTTIEVKPLQALKALLPMDVTLLGMVMEVKPQQFAKAKSPIFTTLLGMVTEVKLQQP